MVREGASATSAHNCDWGQLINTCIRPMDGGPRPAVRTISRGGLGSSVGGLMVAGTGPGCQLGHGRSGFGRRT